MEIMPFKKNSVASFKLYEDLFKTVTTALNILILCEKRNQDSPFLFLLLDTKNKIVDSLSFLATGFNNYETDLKINEYNKARNSISASLSNFMLLKQFDLFSEKEFNEIYEILEEKLSLFSGVIKKLEKRNN